MIKERTNAPNTPRKSPVGRKMYMKVILRKENLRTDGTAPVYIQIFLNKKRKRLPLYISVKPNDWDNKKMRIKPKVKFAKDNNILIEMEVNKLHNIELEYRLRRIPLTMEILLDEYANPSQHTDFLVFYANKLKSQKNILAQNTYRQQRSTLNILKTFQKNIFFSEIDKEFINRLIGYSRKVLKNRQATTSILIKNFKKFLHIANDEGIRTPISYKDIKVKKYHSEKIFLDADEINTLYKYYTNIFIQENHKNVLQRFLFSIFTGLRISDIQRITRDNLIGNTLSLEITKTKRYLRIKLNESAMKFINKDEREPLFTAHYADAKINMILKEIAKRTGIKKKLTFHVARHTFATQWLIQGGDVVNLQKVLGHANIKETMIYVHLVRSITDSQVALLDKILVN